MQTIALLLHNIRSSYNVGAILRTAECLGVEKIYATGYTPYTESDITTDPPHVRMRMKSTIHKTALGTEETIAVKHHEDITKLLTKMRSEGYVVAALEQNNKSIPLHKIEHDRPIALIIGEEVNGVSKELLSYCDSIIEIPMLGKKESFNVSVATAIALYEIRRTQLIEQ